jgi:phage pi2 protein 07
LVDQLGNLQDTIDITAKMVGIEGKPNVIYPKKKISIWELLMREMASAIVNVLNEKGYELSFPLQIK